ncbi:hypothetical protein BDP27DRAFT_1435082 [Rhodocollybia butyracea]|uniref:Uncharacterized protein n=1 Tax=Rhodocollybia butyracea TaxID=206335 RepID=A0A9P5P6R1_9AGAR|nr:hypothetical protein BDP27DRAFT_1435082 [Rhodocollybia butyracea]
MAEMHTPRWILLSLYFASTPMFFSARHSEAQAAHRPGTDGRDDSPYNDFETAVHRLEQFRRGHAVSANGGNPEMNMNGDGIVSWDSVRNSEASWPGW